jgi:hypothetical protein
MAAFPRTSVGGVSVSRLIIGTNWFLGYTHSTRGQSRTNAERVNHRDAVAGIIEAFVEFGVDSIMCPHTDTVIPEAIEEARQRTGQPLVVISTFALPMNRRTALDGFDLGEVERVLDEQAARGVDIAMPHQSVTDAMLDKCSREIRQMVPVCARIRERNMVPGLSTHAPEAVVYADESGLDVESYIQPYNLLGFLMQVEVDWISRIIQNAKKPVMTIKSMAAGQIRPFQALTFSWNTIRPCDMVTVGTSSVHEARELCEMSLQILARQPLTQELQKTRSKASLTPSQP